jgi:type I restriction enzyme, S subunit
MTLVETDLGKFPKTWPLKTVGEIFDTQLGKLLSQKAHGGGDPKPYLRNKNVQWGTIETSDMLVMDFNEREKEKFRLLPGDLRVCEGGVVGRAALWNGAISECYYQKALHRLRPTNGSVTNEFMLYWLRFAFEIQNFYGVSGASSTIAHLPAAQLRALEVPLPPLLEQKKIAHILSTVQRAIEAQERIIQTTTELKKALMHKLFTEGLRGEAPKQTEVGPIPESWKTPTVESVCAIKASAMSYKQWRMLQTCPMESA